MINSYQMQLDNEMRAQAMKQQSQQQTMGMLQDMMSKISNRRQQQEQFQQSYDLDKSNADRTYEQNQKKLSLDQAVTLMEKTGGDPVVVEQLLTTAGIPMTPETKNSLQKGYQLWSTKTEADTRLARTMASASGAALDATGVPVSGDPSAIPSMDLTKVKNRSGMDDLNVYLQVGQGGKASDLAMKEAGMNRTIDLYGGSQKAMEASDDPNALQVSQERGGAETEAQRKSREEMRDYHAASIEARKKEVKDFTLADTQKNLATARAGVNLALKELNDSIADLGNEAGKIWATAKTQKGGKYALEQVVEYARRNKMSTAGLETAYYNLNSYASQTAAFAGELVSRGAMSKDLGSTFIIRPEDGPVFESFAGINKVQSSGGLTPENEAMAALLREEAAKKERLKQEQEPLRGIGGTNLGLGGTKSSRLATPAKPEPEGWDFFNSPLANSVKGLTAVNPSDSSRTSGRR